MIEKIFDDDKNEFKTKYSNVNLLVNDIPTDTIKITVPIGITKFMSLYNLHLLPKTIKIISDSKSIGTWPNNYDYNTDFHLDRTDDIIIINEIENSKKIAKYIINKNGNRKNVK